MGSKGNLLFFSQAFSASAIRATLSFSAATKNDCLPSPSFKKMSELPAVKTSPFELKRKALPISLTVSSAMDLKMSLKSTSKATTRVVFLSPLGCIRMDPVIPGTFSVKKVYGSVQKILSSWDFLIAP